MPCHPERSDSEGIAKSKDERSAKALLLAHVLQRSRAWLIAHPEAQLTPQQHREYDALLQRRAQGEPIAYLIGDAWFYGRRFEVTPAVLIPRPETEHLVDEALAFLNQTRAREPGRTLRVLDVGTGSGAIACTIAAEFPNAHVYATERSSAAFGVAKRNIDGMRSEPAPCHPERSEQRERSRRTGESGCVVLELADLLPADASLRFDCVIANLPYIPSADVPVKPDPVGFEPREATDGGADGLHEYRRLLNVLPPKLRSSALVLLEAAPPTIGRLEELTRRAFPGAQIRRNADYAAVDRFLAARVDKSR